MNGQVAGDCGMRGGPVRLWCFTLGGGGSMEEEGGVETEDLISAAVGLLYSLRAERQRKKGEGVVGGG